MERKLASVQVVLKISNHENSDNLALVCILGWQIVVRRDEIFIGDKVIYCEIDSLLPKNAEWLPSSVKDRILKENHQDYFRVRTVKLRGQLSQGLIIAIRESLSSLNELDVGADVTDRLGIKKYEPENLGGRYCTSNIGIVFPSNFVKKTDEPRIQSYPYLFNDLRGKEYYISEKLDGTSATYFIHPETNEFTVCSRNFTRYRPNNDKTCLYWYIADKLQLENILKNNNNLAIQGEICGPDVQKNLLNLKDLNFYVFNITDLNNYQRLPFNMLISVCDNLHLNTVPILESGNNFNITNISDLLNKTKGIYNGTNNQREGLVIRSKDQLISFKAINNDYLLKHGY